MSQYGIYIISVIIVLILALTILFQQSLFYHAIVKDAKKFANNKYAQKLAERKKSDKKNDGSNYQVKSQIRNELI